MTLTDEDLQERILELTRKPLSRRHLAALWVAITRLWPNHQVLTDGVILPGGVLPRALQLVAKNKDGIPEISAQATWNPHGDGCWILRVTCPYCCKTHQHGGGSGEEPSLGHRVSHCEQRREGDKGYIVSSFKKANKRSRLRRAGG